MSDIAIRAAAFGSLRERLLMRAVAGDDAVALAALLADGIVADGVPLVRLTVSFEVLHPLMAALVVNWRLGEGASAFGVTRDRGRRHNPAWINSPFGRMEAERLTALRLDPRDAETRRRHPIFADWADLGLTDYYAMRITYRAEADANWDDGLVLSAAADGAGFTAAQIAELEALRLTFAAAFKLAIQAQLARTVMETYHGRGVGDRILSGDIRRGEGERIRTVIWMSDLRDSTRLADTLPVDVYLNLMNAYAECAAGAVLAAGGEVLEIIGDAVLAIFPVRRAEEARDAASRAVAAALDARIRLETLHDATACPFCREIEFGVGVHMGEVVLGNVGAEDRLSYGLVGAAVNETARLESLTKELKRPILVSEEVAKLVDRPWSALGFASLRGVARRIQVYAPG